MQVYKKNNQLFPVSKYDAERISDFAENTIFNIKSTKLRSNPQINLYWSILRKVVRATEKWPSEQHLHYELKLALGYFENRYSPLTESFIKEVDSINFQKMDHQKFNKYFEQAVKKLSSAVGFDVVNE